MILVDSSIWVDHFRKGDEELKELLYSCRVLSHPFIIGELSLGNFRNREVVLQMLRDLPQAVVAGEEEMMLFIKNHHLSGLGIGYIDAHLLASAFLTKISLWTRDKKLQETAKRLGYAYVRH